MQRHYKNAAFLTTAMVAVVLALRAWITPHMLDRQDDLYRLSYVVIAVMALTILGVLIWTGLRRQEPLQVSGLWLKPAAVLGMLAGAALVLTCLFDAWNWLLGHTPPAPAVETVGVAGGVVLGLSLLFGLAGGAFLFRIGLLWMAAARACTACGRSARSSGSGCGWPGMRCLTSAPSMSTAAFTISSC